MQLGLDAHAAGPSLRRLEVRDLNIVNPVTTLPMLSEINLHADRGFKIALVGSRGSGKNTLLAAVQRRVDPCQTLSGKVYVDGRNIQTVPDRDFHRLVFRLTGKFKLFAGSLRENLDPLREFSDLQVVRALEYVGYWKQVEEEKKASAIPRPRDADRKRANSSPSVSLAIERIKKRFGITSAGAEPVPSFSAKYKVLGRGDKALSKDRLKNAKKNNPLRKLNSSQALADDAAPEEQNSADLSRTQYFQPSFNKDQPSKAFFDTEEEIEKSRLTQVEASFVSGAREPVGEEVAQPSKGLCRQASYLKNDRHLELHEDLDLRIEGCSFEERADDLDLESDEDLGVFTLNRHLNQDRGKRRLSNLKLTQ
jgi:energy-coupling factor transporter ATP-binding protein EcfA2